MQIISSLGISQTGKAGAAVLSSQLHTAFLKGEGIAAPV